MTRYARSLRFGCCGTITISSYILFSVASFGSALIANNVGLSSKKEIIVITHAAGRMGKLLALQIKEDAEIAGREVPMIRAIVRSEAEASSVQCDLGGMTMVGGKVAPIPVSWLETVVVDDIEPGGGKLYVAFQGANTAILCDASHNEIVWGGNNPSGGFCSISVPAAESMDLSKRLLAEIDAASSSPTLRHVVLRSSMGLAAGSDSDAGITMGGGAALNGPLKAEKALRSSTLDFTILRLGALTDDAGMVPLIFGTDDSILLKRLDSTTTRRPPIISRADAARISTFLVRETKAFVGVTIDCSWHPKFGRSSVGTEEATSAAARQDLKKEINRSCIITHP